ncbi:MAG: alpha/beta fold hydrolase [Gaiellaceae bacterium]
MSSDRQVASAPDGRTLTFAEWGDPGGFPVFLLHGTPGSRLTRHYDERVYADAGARVITYDRPGYGGSDKQRGRRIVDCVGDIATIADVLGIERFAVGGGSGGGPHALAAAARLPDRVSRAACVAGCAPFDIPGFDWFEGTDSLNIQECEWALQGEEVLVRELEREAADLLERVAADPAQVLGDEWGLSEADRAELARPERHEVIRQDVEEAVRTGVWGWADDDLGVIVPWGFDVAEIGVPTRIVYGLTDVLVPPQHGEWLARNVPGAEVVVWETLGHLTPPDLVAERIAWLVGAV